MSDVSNGPDWWQASDGKWYPPGQQPGSQTSTPQPPSGYTPRASNIPASKSSFTFDMKRWSQPERTTAFATLVLAISLFLPWFTISGGSLDGFWHGWMYIVFILCLVILVYLVAKASYPEMPFKLPFTEDQLLLYATSVNLVLTILGFILKPSAFGLYSFGWGFGAFVGLVAALVAAVPLGLPALRARRR